MRKSKNVKIFFHFFQSLPISLLFTLQPCSTASIFDQKSRKYRKIPKIQDKIADWILHVL